MNREAQKILGTQVKELLAKAVGGIYVGRAFQCAITDCFSEFFVTEDGLEIVVDDYVTFKLPIADDVEYINYAVATENDEEEWEGSTYFDYCFEFKGYRISFSVTDKGNVLAWEQLAELVDTDRCSLFRVDSVDCGSINVSVDNCNIDVDEREITVISDNANIGLDREVIDTIYNDSIDAKAVCYRIEFNNGAPDICIEVGYGHRLFK